ncbi:hypothetical protein C8A03DRAFT_14397, partial [Achaetomium macrosporum]
CIGTLVPDSACDVAANISCICVPQNLAKTLEACLEGSCPPNDAISVMRTAEIICHRTPRNRKSDFFVSLTIIIPAFLLIILRVLSKLVLGGQLEVDDRIMVTCGVTGLSAFGVDVWHVSADDLTSGLQLLWVDGMLYILTITGAKLSILSFYLRLFSRPRVRACIWAAITFVGVLNIILFAVHIFQCTPIEANWQTWREGYNGPYHCIDQHGFIIAAGWLNILQEVIIIILPIPALMQLDLSRRSKLSAIVLFNMGVLTIGISIIRIYYIIPVTDAVNLSWDFTDPITWSGIEAAFTVIIPCLPALRALIKHWTTPCRPSSQQEPILSNPGPGAPGGKHNSGGRHIRTRATY